MHAISSQDGLFRRNLCYNLLGAFWSAALKFAFVPVYLNILGIEAYGLIAFSFTLQAILQILDLGLSPAMNREMARFSVVEGAAAHCRDFVRTIEVIYWFMGLVMGGAIFFGAHWISSNWITPGILDPAEVKQAIMIMGVMTVFQWPLSLYQAGMIGLQRHGALNALNGTVSVLQNVGAALVLIYISSTITIFFIWLAIVSLIQVIGTTILLWNSLPFAERLPRFSPSSFCETWKFAAGMSGITLCGMILSQTDKILLSKLLLLADYGYYMLAVTVANVLMMVVTPLYNAMFPQFSAYTKIGDEVALRRSYRLNTQIMAVLVIPLATLFVFFSDTLLLLWTGNPSTVAASAPLLAVLAVGTALNGIMYVPYALQLSQGCTSLGLTITIGFIVTMVPALFFMANNFGVFGVASVWALLNIVYLIIGVPLTHRTILVGETQMWFGNVLRVIVVCLVTATVAKSLISQNLAMSYLLLYLSVFMVFSYMVSSLVSCEIRHWMILGVKKLFGMA